MPIRALIDDIGFWLRVGGLDWPTLQPFVAGMIRRAIGVGGWSGAAWAEELLEASDTADRAVAALAVRGWEFRDPLLRLGPPANAVWFWGWTAISTAATPPRAQVVLALCLRQLATACEAAACGAPNHGSAAAVERARIRLEGYELLR